jgi:dynein heavy chain 1, cytosolic
MDDMDSNANFANLPVYLNSDRSDVLFTVDLPFDNGAGSLVSTRAVCLTACS